MLRDPLPTLSFDQPDLLPALESLDEPTLDALGFGVIGFGPDGVVRRYNATESRLAGLRQERVLGEQMFEVVAPCMNNYLVAQRFSDSAASGDTLDTVVDYVLTLRMKPCSVQLRLLADPAMSLRYICVLRRS